MARLVRSIVSHPFAQQHADRRGDGGAVAAGGALGGDPHQGARVDLDDRLADALLEGAAERLQIADDGGPDVARRDHRPRQALPAQAILVVHRGLVAEVGEAAIAVGRPVPEQQQRAVADDRHRAGVRRHVDEQPVAASARRTPPPAAGSPG